MRIKRNGNGEIVCEYCTGEYERVLEARRKIHYIVDTLAIDPIDHEEILEAACNVMGIDSAEI